MTWFHPTPNGDDLIAADTIHLPDGTTLTADTDRTQPIQGWHWFADIAEALAVLAPGAPSQLSSIIAWRLEVDLTREDAIAALVDLTAESLLITHAEHVTPDMTRTLSPLVTPWAAGETVAVDALRSHGHEIWQVIQPHTTQDDWTPAKTPALWRRWRDKTAAPAPWVQPDSTNPYRLGDLVTYQGGIWRSEHASNVWPPGTGALWTRIGDVK